MENISKQCELKDAIPFILFNTSTDASYKKLKFMISSVEEEKTTEQRVNCVNI